MGLSLQRETSVSCQGLVVGLSKFEIVVCLNVHIVVSLKLLATLLKSEEALYLGKKSVKPVSNLLDIQGLILFLLAPLPLSPSYFLLPLFSFCEFVSN